MGFLSKLIGNISGNNGLKVSEQLLFDKVIGFRGIVPGCGTSTIVQNVAYALSETTDLDICVLDVNYLYPTQYSMLVNDDLNKKKDFLDFSGDLSDIAVPTRHRNVYLVSLYDRTVIDMMSSKDSEITIEKLIGTLKSYFDIILVDLSYELTSISTHAAVRCNKIINVADQSLKCVYNLRKSINTLATLAVPIAKANRIILNKVIPDVITNTKGVLEEAGMTVLGEIPISLEIAKAGVSGKIVWSTFKTREEIQIFSSVINIILNDIIQKTPLNVKYLEKGTSEQDSGMSKDYEVIEEVIGGKVEIIGESDTITEEDTDDSEIDLYGED